MKRDFLEEARELLGRCHDALDIALSMNDDWHQRRTYLLKDIEKLLDDSAEEISY